MNEFIFNDIYGNESARDKYQQNPQYRYFNNVLKIHNKYYEHGEMHNYIFSPRTKTKANKVHPSDKYHKLENQVKNQTMYTYYNVEKINSKTFRVSKKNKTSALKNSERFPEKQYATLDQKFTYAPNRNIRNDIKFLQSTLYPKIKEDTAYKNKNRKTFNFKKNSTQRYQQLTKKQDKLNIATISRQLRSFSQQYS